MSELCQHWSQHHYNVNSRYHSYTDRHTALANNLTFITDDGKVVMKGDDTTWLASGVYRNRYVCPPSLSRSSAGVIDLIFQRSYIEPEAVQHW